MLADAGLRFIISHQAVEAMLPALLSDSSINVLLLDAEWATVAAQPTTSAGRAHSAGQSRLCPLHVRLHRPTQRRDDLARRHLQSHALDARALSDESH